MELISFQPTTWTKNGHIQTLLGEFSKIRGSTATAQRKILTLRDGDQISYNLYPGTSNTVVTLGHGLTGSNRSKYIKSIAYELNRRGHTVVAFNHRNCGDGFGLARQTYHSGRSEDFGEMIRALKTGFPGKKQIAIGFSMSGNALLKLLGDPQHQNDPAMGWPDLAIAINAPINIQKTSSLLNRGFNRLYQMNFLKSLNRYSHRLYERGLLEKKYSFSNYSTTMADFDKTFTGPESGYGTAENYYRSCSALQFLTKIKTKTVLITSQDDPFVDSQDFKVAQANPNLNLLIQKHGGHLGYIAKSVLPHGTRRWMDYAILQIIDSDLNGAAPAAMNRIIH